MHFFIDVLLPLPLPKPFTYWVTEEEYQFLRPGFRVGVPFGKSKMYTGIVYRKHEVAPQTYEPKTIAVILEEYPVVTDQQIRLMGMDGTVLFMFYGLRSKGSTSFCFTFDQRNSDS